jgi:two-component system, NtrC family, response regulator AtoC
MSEDSLTILVAEDELEIRDYLEMALKCLGYKVELAQDGAEALECLHAKSNEIAAVLLDFIMPNRDGIETLREIRQYYPELPVIMISGVSSPLNIVTTMKNGATDFLCKPVTHEDLRTAIMRALDVKTVECLRPAKSTVTPKRAFVGRSPRMESIHAILGQVGWSEAPVLIQGETGSGKEMIAREIHANSPRAKKAFFKLNCAALPSELVESELFGYERGAFTGAFQRKPGIFEMADGGTILLDEIGDMDIRLQAKLLQVLQDQEFQRIGGKDTIKVDVRVIAATHRELEEAIRDRRFREDLYYRLNVVNLHIPALRERKGDIIGLAEFLLRKHAKPGAVIPAITPDLKAAMLAWDWPGNVRELENFVRTLLIFQDPAAAASDLRARGERRYPVALPAAATRAAVREDVEPGGEIPILEQVTKAQRQAEADAILSALNATRWNRKQASALLKIDYKALLYKMKKLGMDDKPASDDPPMVMTVGSIS